MTLNSVSRIRLAAAFAALVLLLLSAAGRIDAASHSADEATADGQAVMPVVLEGITNLWASDELLLSGQPTADAFAELEGRGVGFVIDLRHPDERSTLDEPAVLQALGISYSNVPFGSPEELTDEVLDQVRSLLRQQVGQRTLLHCKSGNRVAAVWLAFRILDGGVSWDEALGQAREVGLRSDELEALVHDYVSDPLRIRWAELKRKIRREFPDVPQVSPAQFARQLENTSEPPLILDVREPEEFDVSHLAGAGRALTLSEALKVIDGSAPNREIVVYCSVGYRSSELAAVLVREGFSNVTNLEGSIFEWANRGYPVYHSDGGEPELVHSVHPYDRDWGQLLHRDLWFKLP